MDRRGFLYRLAIGVASAQLLLSCGGKGPTTPSKPEFDVALAGTTGQIADTVRLQFDEIKRLVNNQGTEISYGLQEQDGGWKVYRLSMSDDDPEVQGGKSVGRSTTYLHPVFRHGNDVVHMLFGWGVFTPTIKLVRPNGVVIFEEAIPKSSVPEYVSGKPSSVDFSKLLLIGIGVAVVAFAVWIGAKILGAVIAALAFIAFNALLIGIVLAAVGAVGPAIRWVMDKFGLTEGEVKSWFEVGKDQLTAFIHYMSDEFIPAVYSN